MEIIDLISPSISLNYKGSEKHPNKFGGILTLAVAMCSFAIVIYFGLELWERKQPKAYLINKYVDDIGSVMMEQSSMYPIIGFMDLRNGQTRPFDESIITFSGSITNSQGATISKYEYEKCIYEIDAKGSESIYPAKDDFEKYFCMRKYTDLQTNKTVIQDGKNAEFIYPTIEHGMGTITQIPTIYSLAAKCTNSPACASEKEINDFLSTSVYMFLLADNYFDVTKYASPVTRYRNTIAGLMKGLTAVDNNINLIKVNITTNDGFLLNNHKEIMSYRVTQNEKISYDKEANDPTLFTVSFYAQNMYEVYDRTYIKVQDILASVGGVIKAFMIIASCLNHFSNSYQQIIDTYSFLVNNDHINADKENRKLANSVANSSSYAASEIRLNTNTRKNDHILTKIKKHASIKENAPKLMFWKVVLSLICNKRMDDKVKYIIETRKHLLDEVTIFQNHYDLMKIKEELGKKQDPSPVRNENMIREGGIGNKIIKVSKFGGI